MKISREDFNAYSRAYSRKCKIDNPIEPMMQTLTRAKTSLVQFATTRRACCVDLKSDALVQFTSCRRRRTCDQHKRYDALCVGQQIHSSSNLDWPLSLKVTCNNNAYYYYVSCNYCKICNMTYYLNKDDDFDATFVSIMISAATLLNLYVERTIWMLWQPTNSVKELNRVNLTLYFLLIVLALCSNINVNKQTMPLKNAVK